MQVFFMLLLALMLAGAPRARAQQNPTNAPVPQWAYMGGPKASIRPSDNPDSVLDLCGHYPPAPGVVDTAAWPRWRLEAATWTDAEGDLWLFGGKGYYLCSAEDEANQGSIVLNDLWEYRVSEGRWHWHGGKRHYANQGAPGPLDRFSEQGWPSPRYAALHWKDAQGRFWLYGGAGYPNPYNFAHYADLWCYDPALGQWSRRSGGRSGANPCPQYARRNQAHPGNHPGGRSLKNYGTNRQQHSQHGLPSNRHVWVDDQGRVWMYGAKGMVNYNVLPYEPLCEGASYLRFSESMADLWRLDPETGLWTWLEGGPDLSRRARYQPSGRSHPGASLPLFTWIDRQGRLQMLRTAAPVANGPLYGDPTNPTAYEDFPQNDRWAYDPGTGRWRWGGRDSTYPRRPRYGAAAGPGSMRQSAAWADTAGLLWMYGGEMVIPGAIPPYNDEYEPHTQWWRYNPYTRSWRHLHGDTALGATEARRYGPRGRFDPAYSPGYRSWPLTWATADGRLWMMGTSQSREEGENYASGRMMDLWCARWTPPPPPYVRGRGDTLYFDVRGRAALPPPETRLDSLFAEPFRRLFWSQRRFGCPAGPDTTVWLIAEDTYGRRDSHRVRVVLRDRRPPRLRAATDTVAAYLNAQGRLRLEAAALDRGTTDNCRLERLWVRPAAFGCADTGLHTVWLLAADGSGNRDSTAVTVRVADTSAPALRQPLPESLLALNDRGQAVSPAGSVMQGYLRDNCALSEVRLQPEVWGCGDQGRREGVLIARDRAGNRAVFTWPVRVQDQQPPLFFFLGEGPVGMSPVKAAIAPGDAVPTSSDNCPVEVTRTTGPPPDARLEEGRYAYVWRARDSAGNQAEAGRALTVRRGPAGAFTWEARGLEVEARVRRPASGAAYQWFLEGGEVGAGPRLDYRLEEAGRYPLGLEVAGARGCTTRTQQPVEVVEPGVCHLATAFSPDGQGGNPAWGLQCAGAVEAVQLRIYDRWGAERWQGDQAGLVWEGRDQQGRPLPAGYYRYQVCWSARSAVNRSQRHCRNGLLYLRR
mgnify:CR=1 FL=1